MQTAVRNMAERRRRLVSLASIVDGNDVIACYEVTNKRSIMRARARARF
jgi:TPP-dependent pyruvate/acetoin dehydrogenase alpha subunit